jgi:hypothetical protein
MPGPNVLDLVGDIREAVERLPREALVDILVYVFKEYVVEGPAPLSGAPVEVRDSLEGLSFGEVIRSLQLRLDLPELELFAVEDSGRVLVRAGGRAHAIETAASRPEPTVPPAPISAGPPSPPLPAVSIQARSAETRAGGASAQPAVRAAGAPGTMVVPPYSVAAPPPPVVVSAGPIPSSAPPPRANPIPSSAPPPRGSSPATVSTTSSGSGTAHAATPTPSATGPRQPEGPTQPAHQGSLLEID